MPIAPEIQAEIVRLFHAEGWTRNTIAMQYGLHHSTVCRILARSGLGSDAKVSRPCKSDPYVPFIKQTLEKYPKLNATRLFHMVRERGYTGGLDHFRDVVRRLRPTTTGAEAYLELSTLPGEQAQVDWASFGHIKIGKAEHRLLAFVMVLSWSRRIFLHFYLGDHTENFLRGHIQAFEEYQAVPREILYDNLKTAVLERVGGAIRFNPELLKLSEHYRFGPKPVPVARPTSKGRVERAIQYVRSSFFAARQFTGIEDLNRQALGWCQDEAKERRCPQDKSVTVAEAFASERALMLALPENPYSVFERTPVAAGKTPYVVFEGNRYSIPHQFVRRTLLVEASLAAVRIVDGVNVIAEHPRTFDKGIIVESGGHIERLVQEKRNGKKETGMNRIMNVAPSSKAFFKLAAERGHNMGRLTQVLLGLLDLHGSEELEAALNETLISGTIHSESIRNVLEKRRWARGLPPAVALTFSPTTKSHDLDIKPKSLDTYDRLLRMEDTE